MGIIGVKTWIFKGEILPGEVADLNIKSKASNEAVQAQGGPGGRGGPRKRRGPGPGGPKGQ
ncbi:MAG: hypothetical protein A2255_02050 [Candidatus Melainabacteria bacterium RIFOXYA2_FULL_32_9]|nr:MAG: hypothetical protein A2255_02050 [Candidatus Melainabacteria bacterium RIFOXYA2_FULL_32_9]